MVYGGGGQLGKGVVTEFKKAGWHVLSVDYSPNPEAHASFYLHHATPWSDNTRSVLEWLQAKQMKFDVLANVAGGWLGGSVSRNSIFAEVDQMWDVNVRSAIAAGFIGAQTLRENGIMFFTGAAPCTKGTPGMIGYGMAKASIHHLIKSLAQPQSGIPKSARAVGILPITIDTPLNRKSMPNADFSSWTPISYFAQQMNSWSTAMEKGDEQQQPVNGGLYRFVTKDHVSNVELVTKFYE